MSPPSDGARPAGQRYHMRGNRYGDYDDVPDDNGEWVAAADYDALRAEVERLKGELCYLGAETDMRLGNEIARAEAAEAKVSNVIHNDVYTLMGHAEILRMRGEDDMPKYLLELAGRISQVLGDKALSDRCAALNEGDGE